MHYAARGTVRSSFSSNTASKAGWRDAQVTDKYFLSTKTKAPSKTGKEPRPRAHNHLGEKQRKHRRFEFPSEVREDEPLVLKLVCINRSQEAGARVLFFRCVTAACQGRRPGSGRSDVLHAPWARRHDHSEAASKGSTPNDRNHTDRTL